MVEILIDVMKNSMQRHHGYTPNQSVYNRDIESEEAPLGKGARDDSASLLKLSDINHTMRLERQTAMMNKLLRVRTRRVLRVRTNTRPRLELVLSISYIYSARWYAII